MDAPLEKGSMSWTSKVTNLSLNYCFGERFNVMMLVDKNYNKNNMYVVKYCFTRGSMSCFLYIGDKNMFFVRRRLTDFLSSVCDLHDLLVNQYFRR